MPEGKIKSVKDGKGFPGNDGDWMNCYIVTFESGDTHHYYHSDVFPYKTGDKIKYNVKQGKDKTIMNKVSKAGEKKSFSNYNTPSEVRKVAFSQSVSLSIRFSVAAEKDLPDVGTVIAGARQIYEWVIKPSIDRDDMMKRYHALSEAINLMQLPAWKEVTKLSVLLEDAEEIYKETMSHGEE